RSDATDVEGRVALGRAIAETGVILCERSVLAAEEDAAVERDDHDHALAVRRARQRGPCMALIEVERAFVRAEHGTKGRYVGDARGELVPGAEGFIGDDRRAPHVKHGLDARSDREDLAG